MPATFQQIYSALDTIRPNAAYSLASASYDGIIWTDVVQTKPTLGEYAAAIASARIAAYTASVARLQNNRGDTQILAMMNRLEIATNAQIANYVSNNVTDLASAKVLLTQMLLILAMDMRAP